MMTAKNCNLTNTTLISRLEKSVDNLDLCLRGSAIIGVQSPRVRYFSQCVVGREYFGENELYPQSLHQSNLFWNVTDPSMSFSSQGSMCVMGPGFLMGQSNSLRLVFIGAQKTNKYIYDLAPYGFATLDQYFCLGSSEYVGVLGRDAAFKYIFAVLTSKYRVGSKRVTHLIKFVDPVSEFVAVLRERSSVYISYRELGNLRNKRIDLHGPLVYVNSVVDASVATSVTVQNSMNSQLAVVNTNFVMVPHNNTIGGVNKVAIQNKNFSLDALFDIRGPVFAFNWSIPAESSKIELYQRLYFERFVLASTNRTYARYAIKGDVAARLEFNGIQTNLLIYKDPITLRANLTLEHTSDTTVAIAADTNYNFAYSIAKGYLNNEEYIFLYKSSLVPTVLDSAKAYITSEISGDTIRINLADGPNFIISEYLSSDFLLHLGVVNTAAMTATWSELTRSKSSLIRQGSLSLTQ